MSQRGSFTTQYIYNDADAEIVRKALDRKSKYLCISPPATWSNGTETFRMPIISGKVGGLCSGDEWLELFEMFEDLKTEQPVAAVVMCDDSKLVLVAKTPKGHVAAFKLSITEELAYTPGIFEEVQDGRA